MALIAGQYTAVYNSLAVGPTVEGYRFEYEMFMRLITSDAFAESPFDGVYRGFRNSIEFSVLNYNGAASLAAMWPLSATLLDGGVIGRLASAMWHSLILTAVTGTPAAIAAAPTSLTLPNSMLHENFPVGILFEPDLRELPLRMRIFPNASNVSGTQT